LHLTALDWAAIAAYLLITLVLGLVSLTYGVALYRLMPQSTEWRI
jgi:hypothetical protein